MRTLLLVAVLFGGVLAFVPSPSQAITPNILDYWWEAKYPVHPSNVTLFAKVDWNGETPFAVSATYCQIDPVGTCLYKDMTYDAATDTWQSTVPTYADHAGAAYQAYATNSLYESGYADHKKYVLFVNSIDLAATVTPQTALPAEDVVVSGQARYNANASTPTETSAVTVKVDGAVVWTGATDAAGRFEHSLAASVTPGAHTVHVTVANGSLSDTADTSYIIVSAPSPDFWAYRIDVEPSNPREGGTVTFEATVKNTGNLGGTGSVTIAVDGDTIQEETVTLDAATQRIITTEWPATKGEHTVTVTVAVAGDGSGANDVASETFTVASKPPPDPDDSGGLPLLWIVGAAVAVGGAGGAGAYLLRRRKA